MDVLFCFLMQVLKILVCSVLGGNVAMDVLFFPFLSSESECECGAG